MHEQSVHTAELQQDFYTKLDCLLSGLEEVKARLENGHPDRQFTPHMYPELLHRNAAQVHAERAVVDHVISNDGQLSFDNQQRVLESFELCNPLPSEDDYLAETGLSVGGHFMGKGFTGEIMKSRARFQLTGPDAKPDLRVVVECTLDDGSVYVVTLANTTQQVVMRLR